MKKFWVLFSLFILPLVFYIFLLTGTNNFAKLPILTENVKDISQFSNADSLSLEGKISILCFFGNDLLKIKNNALNINEKIYKHFYKFRDFQIIVVLPKGSEEQVEELKKDLGAITDIQKWKFVFGTPAEVSDIFSSLNTTYQLNSSSYSPYVFIVDKDKNLRGRDEDEDVASGILYGYNAETVAPIHGKMVDDVKVVVAEYRLALKKNKREI